jgi:hypothetical protein
VGSLGLSPGDAAIRDHVVGLGFEVILQGAGEPREPDLRRTSVILISSSVTSFEINTYYRALPIPILTWESWLYDDLGMTGVAKTNGEADSTRDDFEPTEVILKHRGHPLAAGLDGTVGVTRQPRKMTWGRPGPAALWIATLPSKPTHAVIFAYEKGAPMVGMQAAPARRVGFFLWDDSAPVLTPEGWALFDAAVFWCSAGGKGP